MTAVLDAPARTTRAGSAAPSATPDRRAAGISLVLLLLLAGTLLSELPGKTITTDEYVHIPAGYGYLVNRDFRPNNEHPPLAKLWSALPLLVLAPAPPPLVATDAPEQRTMRNARAFWEPNAARFAAIAFWARVPMIGLTLLLGALLFAYARHLFGPRAAVLAVALFALEPTILAHGYIVHTDVPAALAYLATFFALHRYVAAPTMPRAAALGLVAGAACATKFSLLVLAPIIGVILVGLVVVAPRRGGQRVPLAAQAAVVALVAVAVVNGAYLLRHQPLDDLDVAWVREQDPGAAAKILAGIRLLSPVAPPYYLLGAYAVMRHNAEGHPAALLGDYSTRGWWYYFPVAFGLKTTLPFLVLSVGAILGALWGLIRRRDWQFLLLLGPGALYAALAMTSRIDIGIRHLLPVLPFLCILGGVALDRLLRLRTRWPLGRGVAALLLGWMAFEAARAYPNYLTYTNQLTLGRPGWQLLADSNVEWGEDTATLAHYLHEQGETALRGALAGGQDTLSYYGITYLPLFPPPGEPQAETRYVAIGAGFLNGAGIAIGGQAQPDYFAEYRGRAPDAIFGNSIYLYRARPPLPQLDGALSEDGLRAGLTMRGRVPRLRAGQATTLRVQVGNASALPWPAAGRGTTLYQLRLGNRWLDPREARVVVDDGRAPLPYALYPGERAELSLVIRPPAPGEYLLEIDLVQEGVTWFGARGSAALRLPVVVDP